MKLCLALLLALAQVASADVIATYRQQAAAAAAHGTREIAESYYRRWLALEPSAQLPEGARPAEREALTAAQLYMAARSPLTARAEMHGRQIEVVVVADPLVMVAAVSIDGVRHELGPDRRARAEASGRRAAVALLDEAGNHLIELEASDPNAPAPEPTGDPPWIPRDPPRTAFARDPMAWLVPAGAFALTGASFAFEARESRSDPERHHHYVQIAEAGFALGGACALTAAVMYVLRPEHVKPAPGGVAIAF